LILGGEGVRKKEISGEVIKAGTGEQQAKIIKED
jgi:hypothetical protein